MSLWHTLKHPRTSRPVYCTETWYMRSMLTPAKDGALTEYEATHWPNDRPISSHEDGSKLSPRRIFDHYSTRRSWTNDVSMPGQRTRRCATFYAVLCERPVTLRLMFLGTDHHGRRHETLAQCLLNCWAIVGDAVPALNKHGANMSC